MGTAPHERRQVVLLVDRKSSGVRAEFDAESSNQSAKPNVYSLRSATAHGSRVHGLEMVFGALVTPPAYAAGVSDFVSIFVHRTVPQMAKAARSLLLQVLGA